jgi:hypothetical protein
MVALRLEAFAPITTEEERVGDTRLGLPALVVEIASKLPSPDASFGATTFIACVNHIFYRIAASRRIVPTLHSETAGACSTVFSTIIQTLV